MSILLSRQETAHFVCVLVTAGILWTNVDAGKYQFQ